MKILTVKIIKKKDNMYIPNMFEVCLNANNLDNKYMYVGLFKGNHLLFDFATDKYAQVDELEIRHAPMELWNQEEETYGIPIFPNRKVGDKISLDEEETVIIAVAPILPPYALHFEYLVMNNQGEILKFREDGYIPDKYLE